MDMLEFITHSLLDEDTSSDIEKSFDKAITQLLEAAKAGDKCQAAHEAVYFNHIDIRSYYFKKGLKAGIQLMNEIINA